MTFEELKAEAERQGYTLIKFKKRERLMPCVCGHNRRNEWINSVSGLITLECKSCGRKAKGFSRSEAVHEWNKMIKELQNDNQ